MAETETNVGLKRKADDNQDEDDEGECDEWVGPMPSEASKVKKRKGWFLWLTSWPFMKNIHKC